MGPTATHQEFVYPPCRAGLWGFALAFCFTWDDFPWDGSSPFTHLPVSTFHSTHYPVMFLSQHESLFEVPLLSL